MEAIQTIEEKGVATAIFQFIFPFSFKTGYEQNMFPFLQKTIFVLFGSIISMMKIHIMGSLKFHIKIWKHTIFHLQIKFSFLTQSIKRACNVIQKILT